MIYNRTLGEIAREVDGCTMRAQEIRSILSDTLPEDEDAILKIGACRHLSEALESVLARLSSDIEEATCIDEGGGLELQEAAR